MTDVVPTVACPKCKAMQDDYDGFGFQYCPICSYCLHPSITDGVCDLCSRLQPPQPGDGK